MTTATAPTVSREVLQDRWDSVMEWSRTRGNASDEYLALVNALDDLVAKVIGQEPKGEVVLDDDLLFGIGELIITRVLDLGIAR